MRRLVVADVLPRDRRAILRIVHQRHAAASPRGSSSCRSAATGCRPCARSLPRASRRGCRPRATASPCCRCSRPRRSPSAAAASEPGLPVPLARSSCCRESRGADRRPTTRRSSPTAARRRSARRGRRAGRPATSVQNSAPGWRGIDVGRQAAPDVARRAARPTGSGPFARRRAPRPASSARPSPLRSRECRRPRAPGRDGSRSPTCSASPWRRPVEKSPRPSSSTTIDP